MAGVIGFANSGNVLKFKSDNTISSITVLTINAVTGVVTSNYLTLEQRKNVQAFYLSLTELLNDTERGNVVQSSLKYMFTVLDVEGAAYPSGGAIMRIQNAGGNSWNVNIDNIGTGTVRFTAFYLPHSIPGGVVTSVSANENPLWQGVAKYNGAPAGPSLAPLAAVGYFSNTGNQNATKVGAGVYDVPVDSNVNAESSFLAFVSCVTASNIATIRYSGVAGLLRVEVTDDAGAAVDDTFTFGWLRAN